MNFLSDLFGGGGGQMPMGDMMQPGEAQDPMKQQASEMAMQELEAANMTDLSDPYAKKTYVNLFNRFYAKLQGQQGGQEQPMGQQGY